MKFVSNNLFGAVCFGCVSAILFPATATGLRADDAVKTAMEMLKLPPRPPRPALGPSKLPLSFIPHERIAFVGNSTAERMNLFGNFETHLLLRFPKEELVIRNFARPADEVGVRQRASDYTKLDDPVAAFGADTYFCFFGFNESFAGQAGVEKFKADYAKYLDEMAQKYPRDDAGASPRFVLVSPIAFESTGDPLAPQGVEENKNLQLYADATKQLASDKGLAFIDLMQPTAQKFAEKEGAQFTINGCHLNEAGDKAVAEILEQALFGKPSVYASDDVYEKLRNAVVDKSWVHLQDYRMLNGWYVYGGRRTWDTETFPREYVKIRKMVAVRDRYVWDIASGKPVAEKPDDSGTGELITPPTRFGESRQKYSENQEGGPVILPPEKLIKTCTMPEGFEMKLFADETKFPEIAKPVQLTFDGKGRLWLSTMPSYPQWKPGDAKPNDKLVILEDTDNDGTADKSTVFYDKLHCPTGFEFFNGGVLVVDQPRLIWLKDNDGDDKADEVVHVLDGFATEDTHHTIGAFESNHAGLLHMLEGVSMSTAVETPWGPFRNFGSSGCYVLDPKTWKISHYNTPGYGNPWCYLFNEWGQGFCGDGTGANQHWDTPLSGAQYQGRKGLNPVFNTESMRPVVGSEFLFSRQFPDDVQGQFLYACVINTNGMPRWKFSDEGGGYRGSRIRRDDKDPKTAFDFLKSTDKHFRPVDPQIGPDGALWFGDWANPLIGHMQYSQRDPNRDHIHGRVYRMFYKEKPLLAPVMQFGKSNSELLDQLKEYELRTRIRARRELQSRPQTEVLAAAKAWLNSQDKAGADFERLRNEVLWLQQHFHAVDLVLLKEALASKSADSRAAAARTLSDERAYLSGVQELLETLTSDAHPRVRVEAVRGLSFFSNDNATKAVLAALNGQENDYFVEYTVSAALGANIQSWRGGHLKGEIATTKAAKDLLDGVIALDKKGAEAVPYLQILLGKDQQPEEARNKAMQAIADIKGGNIDNGKAVFRRTCTACHRVYGEGAAFGPDMEKVGTRLSKYKLVESVIDPNAEIDAKYESTMILTDEGTVISGLLVSEDDEKVIIFDGKEKKTVLKESIEERKKQRQSSMPEGLAGTIAPSEFLDVLAFLHSLK